MFIPDMLTVAEIAKILRVSEKTIYKMIRDGSLCYIRARGSIRIPSSEIAALIYQKSEEDYRCHPTS